MTRARILYDCLKRDGVENDISGMIQSYCPKHFGLSEFADCRFKTEHIADSYECLQCWMGEERKEVKENE